MAFLELDHVCVHYPVRSAWGRPGELVRAVDDVSLRIERRALLGLGGESGCGKSTLSRAIMQLQPLTSGRIVLAVRSCRLCRRGGCAGDGWVFRWCFRYRMRL